MQRHGKIPRLIQRLMKFSIKSVNIGGDVVFHIVHITNSVYLVF